MFSDLQYRVEYEEDSHHFCELLLNSSLYSDYKNMLCSQPTASHFSECYVGCPVVNHNN
jgi:hypothetical protein